MRKTAPALILTLALGLVSKTVSAVPLPPDPSGVGMMAAVSAVVIAVIDGGAASATHAQAKPAPSQSDEFAALNSMTESLSLMDQSAGGSADLKTLLQ